jgi:hypothetical protein
MHIIRPKTIETLKIQKIIAVMNEIKNAPTKIRIACRSIQRGEEIIRKTTNQNQVKSFIFN